MDAQSVDLPDDLEALKAELAVARAKNADDAALIARQKLEIAKLKRELYGPRSERSARLIEQMERDGVVSGPEHNGNRTVIAPPPPRD